MIIVPPQGSCEETMPRKVGMRISLGRLCALASGEKDRSSQEEKTENRRMMFV